MGLIAACLPTQYGLFNSMSFHSFIQRFGSKIPLPFLRSATQQRSRPELWASDTQRITTYAEGPGRDYVKINDSYEMKDGITITREFRFNQETALASRDEI